MRMEIYQERGEKFLILMYTSYPSVYICMPSDTATQITRRLLQKWDLGKFQKDFSQTFKNFKFVFKFKYLNLNLYSLSSGGEGNGTPLQYSCLENPMGGRAWWAAVHGVAKSRTRLSNFTFTFHFPALEKEMATHSSVLFHVQF